MQSLTLPTALSLQQIFPSSHYNILFLIIVPFKFFTNNYHILWFQYRHFSPNSPNSPIRHPVADPLLYSLPFIAPHSSLPIYRYPETFPTFLSFYTCISPQSSTFHPVIPQQPNPMYYTTTFFSLHYRPYTDLAPES